MKLLGATLREYGERSEFEKDVIRYISPNLRSRHRANFTTSAPRFWPTGWGYPQRGHSG